MEESIGYLIRQAQLAMHRTIDERMVELELTALQWIPLLLLDQGKAQTAAELSRCLGVDTSTATRMLDRLEAKGLLERKRSAEDRRIINLVLTETGKTLAVRIPYVTADALNLHLRNFSQAEFNELKRLLRKLTANEEGPKCE
jgi:DNA-binding MarR family transcriptional regulator